MKNFFKKVYRSQTNITKEEMQELLNNNENVVLLDVRSPQEFKEGHLEGAINIPTYELKYKAHIFLVNKDSIIIAYCAFGIRSKKAVKILRKLGYKNIYHLQSGIEG